MATKILSTTTWIREQNAGKVFTLSSFSLHIRQTEKFKVLSNGKPYVAIKALTYFWRVGTELAPDWLSTCVLYGSFCLTT